MQDITHTQTGAPASLAEADGPSFVVGQDQSGQWLAIETHGLAGGIFASREAALRYATSESDRRPDAVRIAGEPVELRI